jgi:hypothetical protein
MKKIFTLIILSAIIARVSGQATISPAVGSAQCPNVPITFTVTLPIPYNNFKPYSNAVSGISLFIDTHEDGFTYNTVAPTVNSVSTNYTGTLSNTQFTFVGTFQDNSTPQSFEIQAYDNTGTLYTYYLIFTMIKSFYPAITQFYDQQNIPKFQQYINSETVTLSSPSTQPFTSFDAPLCTQVTKTIYFPAVYMFGNNPSYNCCYEPIQLNFSGIPGYQYLIPAGWSLTSSFGPPAHVSDGSTWITSNNNVTIISDFTHGHGSSILIRAVNPCGSNLAPGPITTIPVNRPVPPTLTVTTPTGVNELCSGSKTYTVTGAAANATYSWTISPTSLATIPANSTSSSVTVTRVGTASGIVTLTANATDCETVSKPVNIVVGAPTGEAVRSVSNITDCQTGNSNFVILPSAPGSPTTYNGNLTVADPTGVATNYVWGLNAPTNTSGISFGDNGGGTVNVLSKVAHPGTLLLQCVASNTCGSYTGYYYFSTTNCGAVQSINPLFLHGNSTEEADDNLSPGQHLNIYPNPAKTTITVNLPGNVELKNAFIEIYDAYGRKVKKITSPGYSNNIMIQDLASGTYFVEIYNNQKLVTVKKLVKN